MTGIPDKRSGNKDTMKQKMARCPICKKETPWDGNEHRPFCSERCRLIDLGKWASGDYRIAGEKRETHDADPQEKNRTEE